MAKTAIQKVKPQLDLPAHLRDDVREGVDVLKQFRTIPRIKVIQPTSDIELKKAYGGEGKLIITGANPTPIPDSFRFVPVFFFVEYLEVNDYTLKGTLPMIASRSLDPKSQIAINSRSADTRKQAYPDGKHPGKFIKYVEVLNFVCRLPEMPHIEWAVLSFSKGEHKIGRRLSDLITSRNTSIYTNVFQAKVSEEPRKNEQGSWYGIDVDNPEDEPWVSKEDLPAYKMMYEGAKKFFQAGEITTDYDDDIATEPGAGPSDRM